MSAVPGPAPLPLPTLPGRRTSCALLTVLTVLLAWPQPPEALGQLVRPAYFALLSWFFWRTTRASPALQQQPMRLVRLGFLILLLAFATSGVIPLLFDDPTTPLLAYLRHACERGALFLLGTTVTAYGLMLWIPQVIASHRLLEEHTARQRGALQDAESARSALEQRLIEADRRAMLGELAATIAHDLRNPLTIVKGTAESLCRRQRSAEEVAEHTAVIRRNIEKADHTLEALIGLARPRAGAAAQFAAHEVLDEVAELLQVEARRRRTDLVRRATTAPVVLHTDRTLLSQALLNLVLNAVQASRDGGCVELTARSVRRAGRNAVVLAVADRGHGLAPDVRQRLFTPFFTTKPTGTGLGLSSCRRIAGELRGGLRLYPRTRGGTRAVLLLPRTDGDAGSPPKPREEAPAWATTAS